MFDPLHRLLTAGATSGGTWSQSYTYDGFGNLTAITGTAAASYSYSASTNQGPNSDNNGNSLSASSGLSSYYAYTYDIENRIVITPSGGPGGTTFYSYAPGNKRVWRGNGGTTDEVTFWSPSGQKLGTYALISTGQTYTGGVLYGPYFYATQTGTNYYFGSKLIKNAGGWVYSDRLGSIGKFYPYGQERPSPTANGTEKFTGYFRDAETGNDYAVNRYQQPDTGRFLTPDGKGGGPNDPGSFNKYSYAGGDPVNRSDPNGTDWIYIGGQFCSTLDDGGGCYDPGGGSCYALAAAAWMNPEAYVEGCGDPTDWGACMVYAFADGSCGGGGGVPTQPVGAAALTCSYKGAQIQAGRFGLATLPNGSTGTGFFDPITLSFQASGGAGGYSWNVSQTVVFEGSVTYDSGMVQQMPGGAPRNDPLANGQVQPSGSSLSYSDSPGPISPRSGYGNILAARLTYTLVTTVSVTSGYGQTAQCPTIDWTATVKWTTRRGRPVGTGRPR